MSSSNSSSNSNSNQNSAKNNDSPHISTNSFSSSKNLPLFGSSQQHDFNIDDSSLQQFHEEDEEHNLDNSISSQIDDLFNQSDSQYTNQFVYDHIDNNNDNDEDHYSNGSSVTLNETTFDGHLLDETQQLSNCSTKEEEQQLIEDFIENGFQNVVKSQRQSTKKMLENINNYKTKKSSNDPYYLSDHESNIISPISATKIINQSKDSDILSHISKYDDINDLKSNFTSSKLHKNNNRAHNLQYNNKKQLFNNHDFDNDDNNDDIIGQLDNLEDTKGYSVKQWVMMDAPRKEIQRRFKKFLINFSHISSHNNKSSKEEHHNHTKISYYNEMIKKMIRNNSCSIEIDYNFLANSEHILAFFLPEAPKEILMIFNDVLTRHVLNLYPNYERIQNKIFARICNLPLIEDIHLLRQLHLNQLVRIPGVVSSQSSILPQLDLVKYNCIKCGTLSGPFLIEPSTNIVSQKETKPKNCIECHSSGPFSINSKQTLYRNYQSLKIQESPSKVAPGRMPRSKIVILTDDLVDCCRPGDEIEITGIFKNNFDSSLNAKQGFPVFATIIEANHVLVRSNTKTLIEDQISQDDLKKIKYLASKPNVVDLIIKSIAPSIYGKNDIKIALAVALFGGVPKNIQDKHIIRGDINVLMCGDPGTAKSQFLRFLAQIAPRSILTTGQGASAVGLTASVVRNSFDSKSSNQHHHGFSLEAGALVLADRGICLIDEFDKMNERDRTSIHEAMEQQTISISKAGIVATLHARCSVIAASNPLGGRYNPSLTFMDNVDLSEPILSRFDVLCVVKDNQDIFEDEHLARFVCQSHIKSHPDTLSENYSNNQQCDEMMKEKSSQSNINNDYLSDEKCLDPKFLQKYIAFAKENCHPKMSLNGKDQISELYAILRKESQITNSIPVTVRHIESIIRISEAFAKMHLRNHVIDSDIRSAVRISVQSFVDAQKYSVSSSMRVTFSKYLQFGQDRTTLMLFLLKKLFNNKLIYLQNLKKSPDSKYDASNKENIEMTSNSKQNSISIDLKEIETYLLNNIKDPSPNQIQSFLLSKILASNQFIVDQSKNTMSYNF